MKRLKVLSLAALVAFAACDEGTEPVVAPPVTGTISGVVTIEGTARSGVSVTLSTGQTATTDASGAFSFAGVNAGTFTVTISGFPTDASFTTTTKGATITTAGQVVTVNFDGAYVRTSAILGSVAAGGRGLAGVRVAISGSVTAGASVNTDANGQYAFTGLRAGAYTVTISGFNAAEYAFASSTANVTVAAGQSQVASFNGTLIATARITGTVTVEGTPAAGVAVNLSGTSSASTTTDATGAYAFTGLTVGTYNVTISGMPADAQFTEVTKAVTIGTATSIGSASFTGTYIKTSVITGTVAVGGLGLQGVTVTLSGASTGTTATDANGQYTFTGLRGGAYTVTITGFNAAAYAFATPAQSFTLAPAGAYTASFAGARTANHIISGYLYLDENPSSNTFEAGTESALKVEGIKVSLTGDTGPMTTTTDANGMFKFENLPWGTYGVTLDAADTKIPGNVAFKAAFGAQQVVTVPAGGVGTVNYPFSITRQAIKVSAMYRTQTAAAGVGPVPGAAIRLYNTYANAVAGGTTGLLGTTTTTPNLLTNNHGEATFRFARSSDTGPGGGATDNVVFAMLMAAPDASHDALTSANPPVILAPATAAAVIEIKYNPNDSIASAPDFYRFRNRAITLSLTGEEIDLDALGGWRWLVRAGADTTTATVTAYNVAAAADGTLSLDITKAGITGAGLSDANFPDTLYIRLASLGGQPNANGHDFAQTPTGVRGTASGRWLRFIWSGTVAPADTVSIGKQTVRYLDTDIVVRAHQETDDTASYTAGDQVNSANVNGQFYTINPTTGVVTAAGGVVAFGNAVAGGFMTPLTNAALGNQPTGRSYKFKAMPTGPRTVITDTLITFTLDGSKQVDTINVVGGSAGPSTFAWKFNNTQITGQVKADDGTAAPGFKVNIKATDNLGTTRDTTVTVAANGRFATNANLIAGPYTITLQNDSTTWAFTRRLRRTTSTVDLGGRYIAAGRTSILLMPNAAPMDAANPGASGSTTQDNDSPTSAVRATAGNGGVAWANFLANRTDGRIRGLVVNDRDSDFNTVDAGEALAGVQFQLYKDNSGAPVTISNDSLVAEATTDGNGVYDFRNLAEGRYILRKVNNTPAGQPVSVIGDVRWVPTDTVIVQIAASATCSALVAPTVGVNTGSGGDLCRTVGSTSGYTGAAGFRLPTWDYAGTGSSAGLYQGTQYRVAGVDGVRRTNFTFLYQNGTVNGTVTKAGSAASAAGLTVLLQLCQQTNWVLNRLPVAQAWNTNTCIPGAYSASATVSASGTYTFANLQEGVYRVNISGVPTREGFLWILGSGDIQTVPVLAEP